MDLKSIQYKEAIAHYQQMKKEFLLLYQKIGNDIVGSASRDFSEKMRLEIEQEPVEAELEKAKDLLKRVAQKMTNKDEKKQTISEARKIARERELKGRELGEKELNELRNMLITEVELAEIVKDGIASYGEGFESIDLLNQAKGYANAIVKQRIVNQSSHNPKIQSRAGKMKGYFREGLVYKALNSIFNSLDANPPVEVIAQGAKNTEIDTLIRFTDTRLSEIIKLPISTTEFGVQEKSWISPWLNTRASGSEKSIYFYSIGHRENLKNQFLLQSKYPNWEAAVWFLGQKQNTLEAIGRKNALYVTGSGFSFTADLIKTMRQHKYYIAFVYSMHDYIPTGSITWQTRKAHFRAYQAQVLKS